MPRVVRHNLSGGELGESLWTRSDLDAYHKGNKIQKNFVSTVHGGIKRRPPAEFLTGLDNKYFDGVEYKPDEVRGFSFVTSTSSEEKYSAILVSFTPNEVADDPVPPDRTTFEIYSAGGEFKASVPVNYAAEHFYELDHLQINDVLMITHNLYEPSRLVRHGDTDWKFAAMALGGAPYQDLNTEGALELTSSLTSWLDDITYLKGDDLFGAENGTGMVTWVGTLKSFNDLSAMQSPPNEAQIEADWAWKDDYFAEGGNADFQAYEYGYHPRVLVRVTGDIPAGLSEGDSVSIDLWMKETNAPFKVSGDIFRIYTATVGTEYFLLLSTGMMYLMDYGVYAHPDIEHTIEWVHGGLSAEVPTEAEWWYENGTESERGLALSVMSDTDRTYYQFVFGTEVGGGEAATGGGAVRIEGGTQVPNLTYLGFGNYFTARKTSLNIPPNPTASTEYWTKHTSSPPLASRLCRVTSTGFAPFTPDKRGSTIMRRGASAINLRGSYNSAGQTSPEVYATGYIVLTTEGSVWSGELALQTKRDGTDTWQTLGSIVSTGDSNATITRSISGRGTRLRVRMIASAGADLCKWHLEAPDGYGIDYQILKVESTNAVIARIISGDYKFFTSYVWAFSAFGGGFGFPARLAIHEERLILGGTLARPFEFHGSEVNDWTNFAIGTLATSPVIFRLQSDNITQIKWFLSRSSQLYIGTDFGEYVATTPDADTVLSGENPPRITLITPYGSALNRALSVHDEVVHVVGDHLTLRALTQKEYTESSTSKSLTIFSPDIAKPSLREIHLQRNPYATIWGLRSDGVMVAFTYDVENGIMGWAKVDLPSAFVKSHWIIPNHEGVDEVYFLNHAPSFTLHATGSITDGFITVADPHAGAVKYVMVHSDYVPSGGRYHYINDHHYRHPDLWVLDHAGGNRWGLQSDIPVSQNFTSAKPPPFTGWIHPTHTVSTSYVKFEGKGGNYDITYGAEGLYLIVERATGAKLFNSPTKAGTYLPHPDNPDQTGSVEIIGGSFYLEKLVVPTVEEPATRGVRDFGDAEFESLVEFSSLVQGNGILMRNVVRATRVLLYLVRSQGGEVSVDGGDTWSKIEYGTDELYTGLVEVRVNSGNVEDLRVMVRTSDPFPFELTGIGVDIDKETTTRRYD